MNEATTPANKNKPCLATKRYGLAEYRINAATLEDENTITKPMTNNTTLINSNHLSIYRNIFISSLPIVKLIITYN